MVMLVGLVVVASMAPVWPLAVVAVALLAIVVLEGSGPRQPVAYAGDAHDSAAQDAAPTAA